MALNIIDKVRRGYIIAFFLLLSSYILTFYGTQKVVNQEKWINHTTTVINSLDELLSALKDGDISFTSYLILKNKQILNEYKNAPRHVDSIIAQLKFLTSDNLIQQQRIDTLKIFTNEKFDLMNEGINLFNITHQISDTLVVITDKGKQLMSDATGLVTKMQATENDLIAERSGNVTTLSNFIKVINIISLVIAIVLILYSITTFNKESRAKEQADKNALEFSNKLEAKVNEMEKLNTQLSELRSIEKFAATGRIARAIAHEVRNPLTNINLAAEHLHSEISPSSETELLFDMITRNSNRINELISDLLNSTKAAQLNFKKVAVNDVLDMSLQLAKDRIDLKQIKVIKNYAAGLRDVFVDVEKINIAFLNIIVNAIEAMETKGILTLKTENKNDRCVVIISDNGKGISKQSQPKLFEAYFTTKEKGTGLGLTNTQNIILGHNANIYAESTEGEGASFIISFNYA